MGWGGGEVHVSISMSDWIDKGEIMYMPGWNKWSLWIPVFQAHMASKLMSTFKCLDLLVLKPGKHIELLYKV